MVTKGESCLSSLRGRVDHSKNFEHLAGNSQTLRRVRKINAKLTQSTLIYVTKFCVRIQILGGQPLEHFLITNLENRFWN